MSKNYVITPPPQAALAIQGSSDLFPVRRVWCVGRNYHAHAKELRDTVFKDSNANPQAWPIVFTNMRRATA